MDIRVLPMAFSRPILERVARGGPLDELGRVFRHSGLTQSVKGAVPLRVWFDKAYASLLKSYRSQYVYKNAIANQLLLRRHSLKEAALFTEFTAGTSKADAVLVNGTSTVYEIKSEFDSIDRLSSQLRSYGEIFDRIYVCTHESQISRLKDQLPAHVGLILLSGRYQLEEIRKARSNRARVVPAMIFHSLRRTEYCSIIEEHFGELPPSAPADISLACHKVFSTLTPGAAHDGMVKALKVRQGAARPTLVRFVRDLPACLRAAALYADFSPRSQESLIGRLDKTVRFS